MDEKRIDGLYFTENFNCAESTLRYLNEKHHLGIADEDLKLVGGFGGGMGCGKTCGVLCASIAAIGKVMIKEKAHEDPAIRDACGAFVSLFEKEMGSVECVELKERYFHDKDGTRCRLTVGKGIALIDQYLEKLEK